MVVLWRGQSKMEILCESGFGFPANNLSKLMVTDVAAPPILAILCLAFASCPPFNALLTSTISCTKPLASISTALAHLWGVILLSASELLQQIREAEVLADSDYLSLSRYLSFLVFT